MSKIKSVRSYLSKIKDAQLLKDAKQLLQNDEVTVIWTASDKVCFSVGGNEEGSNNEIIIPFDKDDNLQIDVNPTPRILAAVMYYIQDKSPHPTSTIAGRIYTREGMIQRVWEERRDKALSAEYKIKLGKHLFGPHILMDSSNKRYDMTIWDFEKETGYIDNIDWKTNKLGTTKHLLYLINYIKNNPSKVKALQKSSQFIEIVPDPLKDYEIKYKYNGKITASQLQKIEELFGKKTHLSIENLVKKMAIFNKF
jgi:hypothetical protein